jgi:ADP-ribose pyrophosphatase YjhB (NUDIX family)
MPRELNYCERCGAPLQRGGEHGPNVLHCSRPSCGVPAFRNPKPCAGALVEQDGRVLLVRRAVTPYLGEWDIPGGFLHEWEHPAEAARREVREETGLDVELTELLGILLDRYGDADHNTLNIYYRARVFAGEARAGDDAADLGWFGPDELPERIAFPDHERRVLALWRHAFASNPEPRADAASVVHVAPAVLRGD